MFDGAKYLKGKEIIGCENEKSMAFFKSRDMGELWQNAKYVQKNTLQLQGGSD